MRILVIGGAGMLGRNTATHLVREHDVRVLDLREAGVPGVESVVGDARSPADVSRALHGMDGVVHMAAVVTRGTGPGALERTRAAFEVNVGSVHLALSLAAAAEVDSFVHISTMSVFKDYRLRTVAPADPGVVPDSAAPYGLTKRLGEQVCAALAPDAGLAVTSLRLVYPTPDDDWPLWRSPHGQPPARMTMATGEQIPALAAADAAAAFVAALNYRGPYEAIAVTADVQGVSVLDDAAGSLLGWRPQRVPAPPG